MVASIPNDIFQFSTYSALQAGYNRGQPRVADLTTHGSHGLGVFEDGKLMILNEWKSSRINPDGSVEEAQKNSSLAFAMVTIFQAQERLTMPSLDMRSLQTLPPSVFMAYVSGANNLVPFLVRAMFESVKFQGGSSATGPSSTSIARKDITGIMFGFIIPPWMEVICGPRIHCHFLCDEEQAGGFVLDFQASEQCTIEWARTGRFHLGFPRGDTWDDLSIGASLEKS